MSRYVVSLSVLGCLCLLLSACGSYRITYQMPSKAPSDITTSKSHSHGIGLLGGGVYFFAIHQMFPAYVDYTGPVDVDEVCPQGFSEVSHYQKFGSNTLAAMISWLTLINVYHPSTIEFTCAAVPQPTTSPQPAPLPSATLPEDSQPTEERN